ncbi:transposase, partial [Klebsiella pneumoniae]|nr:transposase [Klebsiella pneumoniae]
MDRQASRPVTRLLVVPCAGRVAQWLLPVACTPFQPRRLANQALDAKVAAIHQTSGRSYGRPRIVQRLRQQSLMVSAERVRKSLRRQGLRPVYK